MDRLKKLRDLKGKSSMHPLEAKAKMGVVDDLQKMAEQAMGGKLKGLKQVSIASDSPEGLDEGLAKAKDLLHGLHGEASDELHPDEEAHEGEEAEEGSPEEEASESPVEEAHEEDQEGEHMSPEDIDAQIQHLMELKKHLLGKA